MADVRFDQGYFDALYRENPDPWDFRSSAYEREKYAATLAALPRQRYQHVLELGCSIGELTLMLAERAGRVTAVDTSPVALATARERCARASHVRFVQAHLPAGDWAVPADLVVLSEILYYLQPDEVVALARRIALCAPGADMLLVHWTGDTNYPMTGDDAVTTFAAALPTHDARHYRAPRYRLDVLTERSAPR